MKDDGTLWTLGVVALLAGAGLVARRGNRALYDVTVVGKREFDATRVLRVDAQNQEEAKDLAEDLGMGLSDWDWQCLDDVWPQDVFADEVVSMPRRSIRDLERQG